MVIDKLHITYGTTAEDIHVKRLKFRRRAQLFQGLKGSATAVDASIPVDRQAEFTVAMIAESVCDANGKLLFTPDDVDDWDDAKRNAYFVAILKHQSPGLEATAKNSSTTPSVAT